MENYKKDFRNYLSVLWLLNYEKTALTMLLKLYDATGHVGGCKKAIQRVKIFLLKTLTI